MIVGLQNDRRAQLRPKNQSLASNRIGFALLRCTIYPAAKAFKANKIYKPDLNGHHCEEHYQLKHICLNPQF